jgi:hypothetical protein
MIPRAPAGPCRTIRSWIPVCLCAAIAVSPAPARAQAGHDSVPLPRATHISYGYDALDQAVIRPSTRSLDLSLLARKVGRSRREAANVDDADQVRLPSTWWQPRLGFRPVSPGEMIVGPGSSAGPAPGKWTVMRAKSQGVSKGFRIKDARGVRFSIKFDPARYPELATSADVVVSKLLWAAGYNVPDNSIAFFRREDLVIAADASHDVAGRKVKIDDAFMDKLLGGIPREPDGRYRVVASRLLEGKPLGEWRYDGRRKDDREDLVPHELRREIRGLWAISAWTNHTDCSARNTLDMYVTDGGRSFVRHYLIDFSGCLGAASIEPQPPSAGTEYLVNFGSITKSLVTLSLMPFKWEPAVDPGIPSVGRIESEVFDPAAWRPYLPNPAFDERTERDIRWGTRIVAAFSDAHIRAAVDAGRYSDPRAAAYLVRILEERRDKLVKRWLPESLAARPDGGRP